MSFVEEDDFSERKAIK